MSRTHPNATFASLNRLVMAGLAAGVVDLVYASTRGFLASGSVTAPWRSVASGWLGRAAHQGGPEMVVLGVATHFALAMLMTAVWIYGLERFAGTGRRKVVGAVIYGVGLYAVMYLIVLPLRWPGASPRWDAGTAMDVLAHVAVGLCAAFVASGPRPAPIR